MPEEITGHQPTLEGGDKRNFLYNENLYVLILLISSEIILVFPNSSEIIVRVLFS
jgi:hypothetical protein